MMPDDGASYDSLARRLVKCGASDVPASNIAGDPASSGNRHFAARFTELSAFNHHFSARRMLWRA
jgi:hypothetical protein